jgi:hypothetical protein
MSFRYESYEAGGGREWMLGHGPTDGPQVLVVPPLFEELNFTRATMVAMMRELAARGIGTWIIDLPGTGESPRMIEDVRIEDWRGAVAAAAARIGQPHVAALRGGNLIDDAARGRSWWRFAPASGDALLRQMERAQAIGDRESGRAVQADAGHVDLVGYRLSVALRDALRVAAPADPGWQHRLVPYAGPGAAPWRRAEPAADAALAAALAADLADWIASCGN